MAKIKTVNQLVSVFRDAANRHYQINGFGLGDNWEVGASEAKIHPVLWINPVSAVMTESENNIGYKTFEIDFEIRIFDLVNKDESNENEVLSDSIDILKDIITEFKGHPYYTNSQLNIVNDIDFEPFTEEFDEEVTGWVCELSFKTPLINSWCGLPMAEIEGFSFPGADCDGYNAICDATYVEDVIGVYPIEVATASGNTKIISIDTSSLTGDTYVTGGTFNNTTNNLELTRNDGVTVLTDLTALKDDTNTYTTGSTLIGNTVYFDRNDSLSAYTLDLSSLEDIKLTGVTWDDKSTLTHTLNDGTIINTTIDTFSGLTVTGSISATTISGGTFYGDGSNLTGIDSTNIYTDDGTIGSGRIATLTDSLRFDNVATSTNFIEFKNANNANALNFFRFYNALETVYTDITAAGNTTTFGIKRNGIKVADFNLNDSYFYSSSSGRIRLSTDVSGADNWQLRAERQGFGNGFSLRNETTSNYVFHANKANDFIVRAFNTLACEEISLQGDTLINGELVLQANGTPVTDGCHINNSYSFYVDGGELKGRYKDNLGVVTDLTIGAYTEYDFALRSGGVTTYYTDFYTCYNDAVSGDIIDVQTDHTTDCGGIAKWSWDKDITINLNGHYLKVTNLDYIGVEAGVKIKMTNGTFEAVSNSINQSAFNFVGTTGTTYFEGDGAVNVFMIGGGSARGAFQQKGAGEVKISGAIMKGNHTFCVRGGSGKMYVDKCIMYTDEATNADAVHSDNVTVTNSTIYGQAFVFSGNYTFSAAGGRSKVRMFKNCSIIPLGTETPIGSRCAIFENCNIEATDNEVRQGIGGEQEYYNCKLERKGTVGFCFNITNTSNARLYNTQIISTGGGVKTNLPVELYHCYVKTESGYGIDLTTSTFDLNVIIDNCYIDTTGGDCIYTNSINDGLNATITNTTLISRTDNEFCLNAPTGTYFKFSKNIFKNTVDSNDVYSRVGLVTENTQVQTTDSFGNIILD